MFEIYFSIARYGTFVFRTDLFSTAKEADAVEAILRGAFSAAGYDITRYQREAAWTTREVSTRG